MDNYENTAIKSYHILEENGKYSVYSPNLIRKGLFVTKKEAIKEALNFTNSDRVPIYEHKSDGRIVNVIYPTKIKKLESSNTCKTKV